jgi:hypothetical protein
MTAHALDHVAIALPSWAPAGPVLAGLLGGRWVHGIRTPELNTCQIQYGNATRVELLEPGPDPGSFVRRFLRGPGGRPHHITFKVADITRSIAASRQAGVEPVQMHIDWDDWKEAFLHPRDTGLGFLAQIVQSTTEPALIYPEGLTPAPWPEPDGIAPADLLAVVAHVPDLAMPRRVLTEILGAAEEPYATEDGWTAHRYTWPAGAALILASATDLPYGPGIQYLAVRPTAPPGLPTTPFCGGYARTEPIAELGVSLLIR